MKKSELKNNGKIALSFHCKSKDEFYAILDAIKRINGRRWIPTSKQWEVPNTPEAQSAIEAIGFQLPTEAVEVFEGIDDTEWKNTELPNESEYDILRPYQIEAMRFFYAKKRVLYSLPMGSGKTAAALLSAKLQDDVPMLIISTASTKSQWVREWEKWLLYTEKQAPKWAGELPIKLYGKKPHTLEKKSYIINWDILTYWKREIHEAGFKLLIADESQYAGNPQSKRSKAFRAIAKKIPKLIALSGTPIRSRPAQFYVLLNTLNIQIFNDYGAFLHRYCDPQYNGYGWQYNGATNTDELHRLASSVMYRREKKDVLKDLPAKTRTIIPLEIDKKAYEKKLTQTQETIKSGGVSRKEVRDAIASLTRSAFDVKKEAVLKWIDEYLDSGQKLVVMAYHRAVVQYLCDYYGKKAVRVDGGSGAKGKQEAVKKFIGNKNVKLFIGNILAAGVGIDGLQEVCDTMAFVEFAQVPTDNEQAEDRLHRLGQGSPVQINYLIAEGTLEEDIMAYLDGKTKMFNAVVKGEDTSEEDLFEGLLKKVMT